MAQTIEQLTEQLREAAQQSRFLTKEFEILERAGVPRIENLVQNSRHYEKAINDVAAALKRLQAEERTLQRTNLLNVNAIPGDYRGSIGGAGGGSGDPVGRQVPFRGSYPQDIYTKGRISELNTSQAFSSSLNVLNAQKKAIEEIERIYGKLTDEVEEYKTEIDAATGRVTVHAQVLRQVGDQTQKAWVSATSDPLTGATSTLSTAQQDFVQRAGGLGRANQMLAQYGMSVSNVTGSYKDLTSNVTRFSIASADGLQTAMGHMDQFGNFTVQAARNASTLTANIQRNIVKVIEWAAATAVVYAVLNQISQAGDRLVEIEETMSDIEIATGAAGDELLRYYDAALQTANLTGVDVTETLEAQQNAYRAAADSTDRFKTANNLLRDSMILSRLGNIDQAESLDTLSASLRNAGLTLDDGAVLLDKWVRITQSAGTSLHTLSDAFAITASVADTVGVSLDQLNAIIAVLDEKSTLSSEEVGNALRTMFANITAPEAIATLEEFGIAVRNVDGDMRSWMDITENIVDLMNTGLLSDEQLNRLANALGGGSRRGPQMLQLWQNFGKVQDLTQESMSASGEAAEAMDIKLETLQASLNTLNNAFNELIATLGFEGGFVEALSAGIDIATDLVRGINSIAESLEGGAVKIAAFAAAFVGLRRLMGGISLQGPSVDQFGRAIPGTGSRFYGAAQTLTGQSQFFSRQAAIQGAVGGGVPVALGALVQGIEQNESWDRVGAKVGASIAGAAIGNMILPGAGGLVGAVIADSFVTQIQNRQDALRAISLGEATTSEGIEQLITDAFSKGLFAPFSELVVGRETRRQYSDVELAQLTARAIKAGAPTGFDIRGSTREQRENLMNLGFTQEEASILDDILYTLKGDSAKLLLEAVDDYNAALEAQANTLEQAAGNIAVPAVTRNIARFAQAPELGGALQGVLGQERNTAYEQAILTGDLTGYAERVSLMQQLGTITASVAVAQGDLNISTEEYISLGKLLTDVSDEERSKIVTLASSINDLRVEREKLIDMGITGSGLANVNKQIADQVKLLEESLELSERAIAIRETREAYRGFTEAPTGAGGEKYTASQLGFEDALAAAREAQDEYAEYLGLDPELLKQSVTDPLILAFADGFETIEGLTPEFQRFLLDMMKETADKMKEDMNFAFKDIRDVSLGTVNSEAFRARLTYYERLMASFAPAGYEEEKQNIGLLLQGNQTKVLNTTMTALNLTLQELVEVEKKQLEGVWNLPSGATAYVPITSLFYRQQSPLPNMGAAQPLPETNEPLDRPSLGTHSARSGEAFGNAAVQDRLEPIRITIQPQRITITLNAKIIAEAVTNQQTVDVQRQRRVFPRARNDVAI